MVVVPHDLQEIDPQLRAYITQHIEWVREDPRAAQRHATLALVYAANKHWAEARDAFCVAVDLAPRDVMANYYLAIATREAGHPETAVDLLRKVVEQHPTFAPAYHRLGYALLDSGRIQEAARALGRAKELKPDAPEAYVGLAAARLRERDYAGAEELLQKAFGLGTKDRTAHYLLGQTFRATGRLAAAKKELDRGSNAKRQYMQDPWTTALTKHAKGVANQVRLAWHFLQTKRPDEAIKTLETTLKWHPDHVESLNNLANIYRERGRLRKARALLLRAEKVGDNAVATSINLAACLLELEDLDEALRYANRSVKLGPKVVDAHVTRALILRRLQRHGEAAAAFETALELDGQNVSLRMELGNEYIALERPADARVQYAIVTTRVPSSVEARLKLCDAYLRIGAF
ncbi:MAG: tetratricopeptide repeat protein, partial [Planctomycetes bacterium]|nr:tetratricopeptide repeat protein [Planctomycetota bacterium]